MKHYFTQLAARPFTFSGKSFRFLICSVMAGRSSGIYETEDPEEIKILDQAVASRRGISEIGAEEAAELKKKASIPLQSPKSGGFRPRLGVPPIQSVPLAVQEAAASAASAKRKTAEEALATGPNPADLIKIERVNPPKPFAGSEKKLENAAKRADKASIRVARASEDS